ncbi:MAG TPA: glutaminyl-peptide cyclotransferase [Cyclobacteriaceae bacterium]|nr:glutaminyl-peptide cyclotransferase [Cyclobacteriaceae bacterium]
MNKSYLATVVYRTIKLSVAYCILFSLLLLSSCGKKGTTTETAYDSLAIKYTIISTLAHDPKAFTQGLVIFNNKILESTGQDDSWIAEVNPASGEQDKKVTLNEQYFGEGITVLNNKIYQLTWTSKVGFIYDASTYKQLGEFTYATQGWGITNDGKNLIMSDGSEKLYFLDTTTLKVNHSIIVMDGNSPIKKLNELEYINGAVYANIWETPLIVKIDPATGKVIGRLDLSLITSEIHQLYPGADVLNGIAYDANSKAILVTGKFWPKAYLLKIK